MSEVIKKLNEIEIKNKRGNPLWQKGIKSPNPGGRPAVAEKIKEIARGKSEAAMNTIIDIMLDEKQMAGVRIAAAKEVLKQAGCGVDKATDSGTPASVPLTTEQLLTLLNKRS